MAVSKVLPGMPEIDVRRDSIHPTVRFAGNVVPKACSMGAARIWHGECVSMVAVGEEENRVINRGHRAKGMIQQANGLNQFPSGINDSQR